MIDTHLTPVAPGTFILGIAYKDGRIEIFEVVGFVLTEGSADVLVLRDGWPQRGTWIWNGLGEDATLTVMRAEKEAMWRREQEAREESRYVR